MRLFAQARKDRVRAARNVSRGGARSSDPGAVRRSGALRRDFNELHSLFGKDLVKSRYVMPLRIAEPCQQVAHRPEPLPHRRIAVAALPVDERVQPVQNGLQRRIAHEQGRAGSMSGVGCLMESCKFARERASLSPPANPMFEHR